MGSPWLIGVASQRRAMTRESHQCSRCVHVGFLSGSVRENLTAACGWSRVFPRQCPVCFPCINEILLSTASNSNQILINKKILYNYSNDRRRIKISRPCFVYYFAHTFTTYETYLPHQAQALKSWRDLVKTERTHPPVLRQTDPLCWGDRLQCKKLCFCIS